MPADRTAKSWDGPPNQRTALTGCCTKADVPSRHWAGGSRSFGGAPSKLTQPRLAPGAPPITTENPGSISPPRLGRVRATSGVPDPPPSEQALPLSLRSIPSRRDTPASKARQPTPTTPSVLHPAEGPIPNDGAKRKKRPLRGGWGFYEQCLRRSSSPLSWPPRAPWG